MIHMTLMQAASLLGAEQIDSKEEFYGTAIDSRTLSQGALFVAVKGERFDGHDYLTQAKEKGATAALVSRRIDSPLPQLIVPDTVAALGKLGAYWRQQFTIPFIAVTGSNGKTTLKNMIAAILTAACHEDATHVLATQGSFNNHLGLPLTLARLDRSHRFAVIEMGMNHFGEIAYLTQLTHPTIAVITNAAASHLEGVGNLEGVARAKAEIFLGLPKQGVAILNRDDAFYDYWYKQAEKYTILTFGFHQNADIRAIIHTVDATQHLTLLTPNGNVDVSLPLLGRHNVQNALAATAAALAAGIDLRAIQTGLETIAPAKGRMQVHALQNGVNVIDDTYNANPFSLQAAVDTLATFSGQRVLVLGDMKELGTEEKNLHHTAGERIRSAGIEHLFTFGTLSANTTQTFGNGAVHFTEQEKLISALKPLLQQNTTILVKGSRSMQMENVVKGLIEQGH